MAQTERDAASSYSGIILVILMSVGALLAQQVPLPSSRPAEAPVTQAAAAAQQNVDARLWQDPFEAIGKIPRKPDQPDGETIHGPTSACGADAAGTFLVMAVMLGGSPYAEAVETRRRTRYAVLSGLARGGYVPRDHEHIGLARPGWAGKPIDVPFEWLYRDDLKPLTAFGEKQTPAAKENKAPQNLLVLWVNELPIREDPLAGLRAIVNQTCCPSGATPTVVIGPSNSDTLRTMLENPGPADARPVLRIYSPRATAPDAALIRDTRFAGDATSKTLNYCSNANRSAETAFNTASQNFHRTIATDCDLAASLVTELRNRDVQAGDGIVLISEWDTAYGRALPQAFLENNETPKNSGALWQFSYLRGLDGKLPGDAADKQAAPDKSSGKSTEKTDAEIESPFGNHQKDYLRRLGDRIDDLDRDLKRNCRLSEAEQKQSKRPCRKQGVEAIGILGSDVYDKLLILKALRLRFPAAIFFTTDLDARLLHPQEWSATRNLIVASGYDLRLNGTLQREIPPFRDGYQTAYFRIAQAVSHPTDIDPLARGAPPPRLFEVGRTRAVDLSPLDEDGASPHPDNSPPPKPAWIAVLLPALLLTALWYGGLKSVAHSHVAAGAGVAGFVRKWPLEITTLLLFGSLAWLGYCIWKDVFVVGTAGGGEPFSWVDGVSVWPSVMLRALTGVLALYLLLRGMHRLWQNDERLTALFFAAPRQTVGADDSDSHLPLRILDPAQPPCPPDSDKAVCIWRDAVQPRPFTWPQFWRLTLGVFTLALIAGMLMALFPGIPNIPYRGETALTIHRLTLIFAVVSYLYLLAFVINSTRRTCCLARRLGSRQATQWPEELKSQWFGKSSPCRQHHDDWIDIQLIAARTAVVGGFIYAPFLILSLMILARSGYTDNWQLPPGLTAMFGFYLLIVLACALMLRRAAERARAHALENLDGEIIAAQGDATREAEIGQLKSLRDSIAHEHRGAFTSFLNQPWLKALLLPLGSYSGIQLFEALSQAKL